MKNHAGKYWPREKQTPFLWPLTSLPESTNVNRFCKFLLLRPTSRMKFSWEPNLVSTPDPRHLVCDKYSNILCFLKYVVGVAGVTGRTDELSEQEYVKVWRTWFLSRGVWAACLGMGWLGRWYPPPGQPPENRDFPEFQISTPCCAACAWGFSAGATIVHSSENHNRMVTRAAEMRWFGHVDITHFHSHT